MPTTGICPNIGNCEKANAKEPIAIPDGADLICPECGTKLLPLRPRPRFPRPVLLGLLVLLALLSIGGFFVYTNVVRAPTPSPTPYSVVDVRPTSAPEQTPSPLPFTPSATPTPAPQQTAIPSPFTPPATPTPAQLPTRTVELRLHGSNTIGKELAPALMESMLKNAGASSILRRPGAKEDETDIDAVLPNEPSQRLTFEIQAHGSQTAFEDLAAGKCDIGMASRQIKPNEAQSCAIAGLGDMLSPACENVLGLDGIAVLVNRSNPIDGLTKQQISDIFTGRTTDWSQLGGNPGPIHLYRRDDKSGTFDTFKTLVLGGSPISDGAVKYEDSDKLSDAVASDPNGIGFTGLPFVRNAKALAVSEAGSRPLLPNRFTISTEDYPISRRLYFYIPANPQNKWTRSFVEFALSKVGQNSLGTIGFVSQTIETAKPDLPENAPRTYVRQTVDAQRLSLNFRFRTGSRQLDNKALRDLDRLVEFLSNSANQNHELLLFGFADNIGTTGANLALSKERAKFVADQLQSRGITPKLVTGYGKELPVASNDTEQGREKNRRVEAWIRQPGTS
jgi:phosphate transport system substrate-binding protein